MSLSVVAPVLGLFGALLVSLTGTAWAVHVVSDRRRMQRCLRDDRAANELRTAAQDVEPQPGEQHQTERQPR